MSDSDSVLRVRLSAVSTRIRDTSALPGGLTLLWIGWCLLDVIAVDLAYAEDAFRFRIEVIGVRPSLPFLQWAPGWLGTLIAWTVTREHNRCARIESTSRTLGLLALLRLISLVPGMGAIAPPLGVLWSSHVSWAISFTLLLYLSYPRVQSWLAARARAAGLGVLIGFGILYTCYAIFFARTTLLHGDETQYMMITQSLVHDGDIDLSNYSPASIREFHELVNVAPRRAPASPDGVTHPTHPIGLGLLLAPAYRLGLTIDNPRLTCAIVVALVASLVLFVAYHWLIASSVSPGAALITATCAGLSPLVFLYSNQIYPGLFAAFASLVVLRAMVSPVTTRSDVKLFLTTSIVIAMPLFHPRLLPLAGLLGSLVLVRVWEDPRRPFLFKGIGAMAAAGTIVYSVYHLHYSGDLFGPFKPGNAWEADVIDFGDFPIAVVGQWMDARVGVLNNSPVFFLSLVGVGMMALTRHPRTLLVVGLYATTAAVNALSIDWSFGYCFPSRFLVTALPALLLPLAVVVQRAFARSSTLVFLIGTAVCLGWDTNAEALTLTEGAYVGGHLIYRSIEQAYPLGAHFPLLKYATAVPWGDVILLLLAVGLTLLLGSNLRKWTLGAVVVAIPILALSIGSSYATRFHGQIGPSLRRFNAENDRPRVDSGHQKRKFQVPGGVRRDGTSYVAVPDVVHPGVVGQSSLPFVSPSVYSTALPTVVTGESDGPAGHYIVTRRYSVRAKTHHETRYAIPLEPGADTALKRFVVTKGKAIPHQFVTYRDGHLLFGPASVVIYPEATVEDRQVVLEMRFDLEPGRSGFRQGFLVPGLRQGHYTMKVHLEGVPLAVWVDRFSDPVVASVFGKVSSPENGEGRATAWLPMPGKPVRDRLPSGVERPVVEAMISPFWESVPFAEQTSFDFEIDEDQSLYVALSYSGEYDLDVRFVELFRRSFRRAVDGAPFVLPEVSEGP